MTLGVKAVLRYNGPRGFEGKIVSPVLHEIQKSIDTTESGRQVIRIFFRPMEIKVSHVSRLLSIFRETLL